MKIPVPYLFVENRPDAYLVGGCVRDLIQGRTPRDFDMAVSGAPRAFAEETATRLGGRLFMLGKDKFTVFCVIANKVQIDIIGYKGATIQDDLLSRDFTINALACRLTDGLIVDVTGGLADLHRRMIRMISPRAFRDDPVRLVRAFRMAATLNFHIEPETLRAIKAHTNLLEQSAPERIWTELRRILVCPNCHQYLLMMYNCNLLQTIVPELVEDQRGLRDTPQEANNVDYTFEAVRCLEEILDRPQAFLPQGPARCIESLAKESRIQLKLAMLLQNIGKPRCRGMDSTGRIHHHGYAARGAELVNTVGRRLRMSNQHREWIASLVRRHQYPLFLFKAGKGRKEPPPAAIGRFFRQCGDQTLHLLILSVADNMARRNLSTPSQAEMMTFITDILTRYVDRIYQKRTLPILNGKDLIQSFNLPPSPVFGTLLRRLDELHLAGMITNRKQALQWVAEQLKIQKNTPRFAGRGCLKSLPKQP